MFTSNYQQNIFLFLLFFFNFKSFVPKPFQGSAIFPSLDKGELNYPTMVMNQLRVSRTVGKE